MADTTDHILNESIDTPEFYETVLSWKENSPDGALWSDVIDKINEYAKREVASALASRPAEVDGSPVDRACARVRSAEAELKAARKALLDVMTTAARADE